MCFCILINMKLNYAQTQKVFINIIIIGTNNNLIYLPLLVLARFIMARLELACSICAAQRLAE